jgi:hypothetical protein
VRRLALLLLVAALSFSASGLMTVVVDEPCSPTESSSQRDTDCPPTCVTCGCCAQRAEVAGVTVTFAPESVSTVQPALVVRVPDSEPQDILHVPRLVLL